jgi:hypothetical protein
VVALFSSDGGTLAGSNAMVGGWGASEGLGLALGLSLGVDSGGCDGPGSEGVGWVLQAARKVAATRAAGMRDVIRRRIGEAAGGESAGYVGVQSVM